MCCVFCTNRWKLVGHFHHISAFAFPGVCIPQMPRLAAFGERLLRSCGRQRYCNYRVAASKDTTDDPYKKNAC